MSILIKGLEMPKITGDFIQEKFVLLICPETGKAEFNDGKKWVDYEMLEVKTPHGRLIDADELLECYTDIEGAFYPEFWNRLQTSIGVIRQNIADMPPIIEEEEG